MGEVHIKRDFRVPAAIQFKNPGAMWPGAIATKWGSTKWQYLSDGTGQGGGGKGNKIAIFDNWVDGICAQLDLWRTSPKYKGKRFDEAIAIWSGRNNVPAYIAHVLARVPGMTRGTIMDDDFWRSSRGLLFLKVQAAHEAGKPIPAPDSDWIAAQTRAFSGVPTKNTVKKAATSIVVGTATGTATGVQGGLNLPVALGIGLAVALVVFLVWKFKPRKVEEDVSPVNAEQPK
jgi:hypothetical protein